MILGALMRNDLGLRLSKRVTVANRSEGQDLMIAVLPQTGQRHRNANGEATVESQSQGVCFIGGTLSLGCG
jgi:hypothetical protein